jgi:hypothetical protein
MSDSLLPPSNSSGGSGRLAIVGVLLLLLGGAAIFFLMKKPAATPAAPTVAPTAVDAGKPPVAPSLRTGPIDKPIDPLPPPVVDAGPPVVAVVDAGPVTPPKPRIIYVDEGPCPGTIDKAQSDAVFRSRFTALHDCYARELRLNGDLQGRVTATLTVNPNGSVGSVSTSGLTSKSSGLNSCFRQVMSALRFPAPKGGCARVHSAFTFSPNN